MQKKFSYRLLKWSLLFATASTLAAACKVSTGDGPDISFGGEPSDDTAGQSSGATSSGGSSAGTNSAGTTNGGKGGSGGTAGTGGTTAGTGGSAGSNSYVPGRCEQDDIDMPPASITRPSCGSDPDDSECLACLKTSCCNLWKDCYRLEPTSACGWGPTPAEDDLGQFDCMVKCVRNADPADPDPVKYQEMCASQCLNQCAETDSGLIRQDTNDLFGCANDMCLAKCFPPSE